MATQNIYSLTDIWNAAGTTFQAIRMTVTNTASQAASSLMQLVVGTISRFDVNVDGTTTVNKNAAAAPTPITGSAVTAAGVDAAAAIVSLDSFGGLTGFYGRRAQGTNASKTAITSGNGLSIFAGLGYDGSAYTGPAGRVLFASSEGWSGTAHGTEILFSTTPNGSTVAALTNRWRMTNDGHFVAVTDNASDIGATGATRPRNVFMAGYGVFGVVAVASLPAAATAGVGARMFVNDALAPVFGNAVAGSGAVTVPVYSTGSAWNVG